jgi:hypothetical protein
MLLEGELFPFNPLPGNEFPGLKSSDLKDFRPRGVAAGPAVNTPRKFLAGYGAEPLFTMGIPCE